MGGQPSRAVGNHPGDGRHDAREKVVRDGSWVVFRGGDVQVDDHPQQELGDEQQASDEVDHQRPVGRPTLSPLLILAIAHACVPSLTSSGPWPNNWVATVTGIFTQKPGLHFAVALASLAISVGGLGQ
jgi:hypothetical protein